MTSTDRLVTGVIAALFAPDARLYEMKAAFGVVIVCVAFATTTEVMMATTAAMRMTADRENFWIRVIVSFIDWKSTRLSFIRVAITFASFCLIYGRSTMYCRKSGKR